MKQKLTPRQREAMTTILAYRKKNGYAPAQTELAIMLEVTAQSAGEMLQRLAEKGYLEISPRVARGVKVLREDF